MLLTSTNSTDTLQFFLSWSPRTAIDDDKVVSLRILETTEGDEGKQRRLPGHTKVYRIANLLEDETEWWLEHNEFLEAEVVHRSRRSSSRYSEPRSSSFITPSGHSVPTAFGFRPGRRCGLGRKDAGIWMECRRTVTPRRCFWATTRPDRRRGWYPSSWRRPGRTLAPPPMERCSYVGRAGKVDNNVHGDDNEGFGLLIGCIIKGDLQLISVISVYVGGNIRDVEIDRLMQSSYHNVIQA